MEHNMESVDTIRKFRIMLKKLISKFTSVSGRNLEQRRELATTAGGETNTVIPDDNEITSVEELNAEVSKIIQEMENPLPIPTIIDNHASRHPQKVFASIPLDNNDLSQGFRDIAYLELRNAVDRAAYWLDEKLGSQQDENNSATKSSSIPTFAFYGTRDLRYSIFVVAAIKCGYKMLSPSLLCSMDAHVHLIKETDCRHLLCIPSMKGLVDGILKGLNHSDSTISTTLPVEFVPELDYFLPTYASEEELTGTPHRSYPYLKSWDDARHDPCLIIHTSGSTGMPKVVLYSQRMLATSFWQDSLPLLHGQPPFVRDWRGRRILTTVPPYHLLGYAGFLACPIYLESITVMAPPDGAFDAELAHKIHLHARLDGGLYHPSLLQDLVRDSSKRDELGKLEFVLFSGSPLETRTGQWLATQFGNVGSIFGSTEGFGWPTASVVDRKNDWNYVHFYPLDGLKFRAVGLQTSTKCTDVTKKTNILGKQTENDEDKDDLNVVGELYELIVHRTVQTETLTNIFRSVPHLSMFPTKDLWKPHPDPTKKNHWLYQGRTDDLVVLSGEIKMYAAHIEDRISSAHPFIRNALIGGNQRKQPFLLLELHDAAVTDEANNTAKNISDEIWPAVNDINVRYLHSSVRLTRSLLILADSNRPFVRLAKGSVARNQTFELYAEEIDRAYAVLE